VRTDNALFPVGAGLGGVGFVVLFVEAVRVVFGEDTLTGVQSWLPWVGLGLLVAGAAILALAVASSDVTGSDVTGSDLAGGDSDG
jgi:hypothetical protein